MYPENVPPLVAEMLSYYVYRLVDPSTGKTFYVGKGRGDRVLCHVRDALGTDLPESRLEKIRSIHRNGMRVRIIIHRHGMDEETALHVEAALIDAYQDHGLTNVVSGQGAELSSTTMEDIMDRYAAPRAELGDLSAILIKIEKQWREDLTPEQLYERTRRYWKMNPTERKVRPTHAIAVARGIIRQVYRIDGWEEYRGWPEDRDLTRLIDNEDKWDNGSLRRGFVGEVDPAFRHLLRCSVDHVFSRGAQNPIRYWVGGRIQDDGVAKAAITAQV